MATGNISEFRIGDVVTARPHGRGEVIKVREGGGLDIRLLQTNQVIKNLDPADVFRPFPGQKDPEDERANAKLAQHPAVDKIYKRGNWHRSNPALNLICTPLEARLLEFLIFWRGRYALARSKAFIKPRSITGAVCGLEKRKLIQLDYRGMPRKRYVFINFDLILERLTAKKRRWRKRYGG